MEAPSLVTHKERQAIAEEIASKYLTFASRVSVSFHKRRIFVEIYPDKVLELPSPGTYCVVIERED